MMPFRSLVLGFGALLLLTLAHAAGPALSPEARVGERLFREVRFAESFAEHSAAAVHHPATVNGRESTSDGAPSCATCHFNSRPGDGSGLPSVGTRSFADFAERSPVPARSDGQLVTPRNTPSLVDLLAGDNPPSLLHFDGEFATPEDLVVGTFLGRNFGWLPSEYAMALKHFARVIREDDGSGSLAGDYRHTPYAVLLRGADSSIPGELLIPETYRLDASQASDEQIVRGCARLVTAYLRALRFQRDSLGRHAGSPYDGFLAANHLPQAPRPGETPHEYARRLREAVAAMSAPRFVDDPEKRLRLHNQAFRFGELELRGMKIFFRGAVGDAQTSGAGNCAECHVPPRFSDDQFHNTGVAQDEYDHRHGVGAFQQLAVPDLAARNADPGRWLPPTPRHPDSKGVFKSPVTAGLQGSADLGLWNVYANTDMPLPQSSIEQVVNRNGHLSPNDTLAACLARFKTPAVRDLGQSGPYLHNGQFRTLEDAVRFYQRMSALAHAGKMRNPPPEYFNVRLGDDDVAPLVAFLRSLNEDYAGPTE